MKFINLRNCLATCAVLSALLAQAQSFQLNGLLTFSDTQTPVPDAHILLAGSNRHVISAPDGTFTIDNIKPGTYTLHISCVGLRSKEQPIEIPQTDSVHIRLKELVYLLPNATISEGSLTGGLQRMRSMPGAAYYLSSNQLVKMHHTDVNRALAVVPGLNIQEEDGVGLRPNIGIRGSGAERSSKITVMEDGVLAAPAPYAAPSAYYFPTVGRMHAVEVLKGAGQIRYGPFTTGGALNFLSTPIPDKLSGSIRMSGGSYGNRDLHALLGNTHEQIAYVFESFQYRSDGFKNVVNGTSGFDKKDYLAKVRLTTKPKARIFQAITLKAGQTREVSDETYLGLTSSHFTSTPYQRYAASQRDQMRARYDQLSLRHSVLFGAGIGMTTTVYRNRFDRNWYKLDKIETAEGNTGIATALSAPEDYTRSMNILAGQSTTPEEGLFVKANNRTYYSQGVQSVFFWDIGDTRSRHHLEAGIRIHRDQMDRYQWVDKYAMADSIMQLVEAGEPGTESNRIQRARATSAYLQYRMRRGALTLYPGVRYEHVILTRRDFGKEDPDRSGSDLSIRSNRTDAVLPGIGIDFRISAACRIIGGVHKGFAPPGSNDGARPESSINYELGWRARKDAMSAEFMLFYHDYSNLLGTDLNASGGNGSNDTYNGGNATVGGIEVMLSHAFMRQQSSWHVPVSVSYTYTRGSFGSSFDSTFDGWGTVDKGDALPYLAPHRLTLESGFVHPVIRTYLTIRYTAAMRTQPGTGLLIADQATDDHLIIDYALHIQLSRQISVFGTVRNLTDAAYIVARRPAGARPGMPRTIQFGIEGSF